MTIQDLLAASVTLHALDVQEAADLAAQITSRANSAALVRQTDNAIAAGIFSRPGHHVVDRKTTPAVLYTSTDGLTFTSEPIDGLDVDVAAPVNPMSVVIPTPNPGT